MTTFLEWIGTVSISSVVVLTAVWAGVKAFAAKWLDSAFSEKLEGVKLEGQKQLADIKKVGDHELEKIKHENAGTLDRTVKLNQREFEAIPDIWKKTTAVHYAVKKLIREFEAYPNFEIMSDAEFAFFVSETTFADWQKDVFKNVSAQARLDYWKSHADWMRVNDANRSINAFNNALREQSIFLHPETFDQFSAFAEHFWDAVTKFLMNLKAGDPFRDFLDEDSPVTIYRSKGDTLYQELGRYLRERYWINAQGEAV